MAKIRPPRFQGTFQLDDGRKLGYAEYGPATGRPLLWFHASPGAKWQIAPDAREDAYDRDIRIITLERPGVGDSTLHLYNAIVDWARDVEEFCDAKGIDKFDVVGLSGGGPYALAVAHEMPERVSSAVILGSLAPATGPEVTEGIVSTATRIASPIMKHVRAPLNLLMRNLIRVAAPRADQLIQLVTSRMPPGDRDLFVNPLTRQMFIEDIVNGGREQMQAFLIDGYLFGRDWGFLLKDIRVQVHMWHGDADPIIPLEHCQHMVDLIPGATFRVRPGEGHLGGLGAFHEIVDTLNDHSTKKPAASTRSRKKKSVSTSRKTQTKKSAPRTTRRSRSATSS
ncbi:MAG: alpha/beta hydrolase [Deltaproteobacteria bacterium]|nr:alpha/beta hydrolase [Deltaproteobacteria bacterium]